MKYFIFEGKGFGPGFEPSVLSLTGFEPPRAGFEPAREGFDLSSLSLEGFDI